MNKKIETPDMKLVFQAPYQAADINLDLALSVFKPASILNKLGIVKRSGDSLEAIIYTIFLLPLLQVRSIYFIFENNLSTLLKGGKDTIYKFIENQSINWSLLSLKIALIFFKKLKWNISTDIHSAFIADDTIKERSGKKVEATSSHWDHNKGRYVKGHQFLQLGFANLSGFLPLLGHFYVSKKKRTPQSKEFRDRRNALSKSYSDAHTLSKHDLLDKLLGKALSFGFHATYLLADAWFGCKKNVKLALKHNLTAIFMMKRGKNKYRYNGEYCTAKTLYREFRKQMTKVKDKSFHACAINVEYNLSDDKNQEQWIEVKLVFSRMKSAPKSSWVVLLCTDTEMTLFEILDVYALRWNIEVYFKEVKQYFGFMKEQSWQYAVCYASVHLAMIRYILFYYLSLKYSSFRLSELRNHISLNVKVFSYGYIAWKSISPIVFNILDNYLYSVGKTAFDKIKFEIEKQVNHYFSSLLPIALGLSNSEIQKLDYSEKKGQL